jgi:predicted alpha/beta hydrolase family esterase
LGLRSDLDRPVSNFDPATAGGWLQVTKRSIALALCCSLVASPVWAKTFVGVLYPLFGPMAAIGLVELAGELKAMPDVEVATYLHQSWKALVDDINRQPKGTRILIVGYSLGANNAILVANSTSYVDEIIALQPSMLTTQASLTGKVGKIIEIYNPNPWMTFGGMGSQKLDAPNIEYIANNDTHPFAQFSEQFHSIVKSELARISALDNVQTAQAKAFKPSQLAKLPPPKDGKSTALAFANTDAPKHEQQKHEQPKPAQLRVEQTRYEQPTQEQKPQPVFAEAPKPQPVFADALLTSVNAGTLFVPRTLTVGDMKEYVKRTYPSSQDFIR